MKKLILLVLCVISFHADASSFVEGSVLTAAELNAAFATADITGGTIDGAIIGYAVKPRRSGRGGCQYRHLHNRPNDLSM